MYTIVSISILFLITIFSILLYINNKKQRLASLQNGICPTCNTEIKQFKDELTGVVFKVNPIESKILRGGGCSGVSDIEYLCKSCGLKEVHAQIAGRCNI